MDIALKDKRSGKVALVAHCILNQNARAHGLAERPHMITEILELLSSCKTGIIQMPCPELTFAGALRKPQAKSGYDTAMFRNHCRKIVRGIVSQIQEYERCGIKLTIMLGVDGSPSCGVDESAEGSGVLMQELRSTLAKEKISAPCYAVGYQNMAEAKPKLRKILRL